MTKLTRFIIIGFLFLLFLFLSPLFIFYARGYRFDWEKKNFQKIGILDIETQPKGAKIYLDAKLIRDLTPYRIENLLPGKYLLRIEKPGYKVWQNEVEIFAERITSVDHIILLPEEVSSRVFIKDAFLEDFNISWDEKLVAYQIKKGSHQGLWILNLKERKTLRITRETFKKIYWSPDNKRILLEKDKVFKILYLDTMNFAKEKPTFYIKDITHIIGGNLSQIEWDPQDSDRLFFLRNETLFLLNLSTFYRYTLLKKVKTFSLHNQDIYALAKSKKKMKLLSLKLYRLDKIKERDAIIHPGENYKLFVKGRNRIAYLVDKKLYLIEEGKSFLLGKNIEDAQWSKDLLYYNQYEIWIYFLRHKKRRILTRVSKPLQNIAWWPYSKYIIFSEGKEIKFLECAEDLAHWKSYKFYQLENLPQKVSFNRYGEVIWIIDGQGKDRSLEELKVREK